MKALERIFAVAGVVLVVISVALGVNTTQFIADSVEAEGTVLSLQASRSSDGTTWRPEVAFQAADGRTYRFVSSSGSNPPAYERGESVMVLYRPDAPEKSRIRGFFSLWGGALICGVLGAVFGGIGFGMIGYQRVSARRGKYLRAHGRRIETTFQGVEQNTSARINGRCPFRIVSQWQNPSDGKVHVFQSSNLWFDPTDHITRRSLTVYIDPQNPRRYVMDTDFLPQTA
ncbi:MAG: DUF3592 domain-containing protein [Alcanivorax sp.]|nr:DUF3592 domain-containing protein [Alcanivorax sp.]